MTTAKLVSDATDNQGPIRAVLVEDHPVVRCGLKALIDNQEDMAVVGEAESGGSALELLKHISCDVIVADLSLGDINGIEMIRRVRNSDIETPILIVSMHEEELYAERALKAGARGYFMKTAPPAELPQWHSASGTQRSCTESRSTRPTSTTRCPRWPFRRPLAL